MPLFLVFVFCPPVGVIYVLLCWLWPSTEMLEERKKRKRQKLERALARKPHYTRNDNSLATGLVDVMITDMWMRDH